MFNLYFWLNKIDINTYKKYRKTDNDRHTDKHCKWQYTLQKWKSSHTVTPPLPKRKDNDPILKTKILFIAANITLHFLPKLSG